MFHPSGKLIKLYAVFFVAVVVIGRLTTHSFQYDVAFWGSVLALGGLWLFYLYLVRVTSLYTIDAMHITSSIGLLAKTVSKIPLNRISNYEVRQTFFQRMLALGDVFIDTPGSKDFELKMTELDKADIDTVVQFLDSLLTHRQGMTAAEA